MIFLVIILILKHVLFRLMQKYLSPVINCLLCFMNWYSWGVIRKSHRIRTRSHRIRMVVKCYNHTVRMRSDAVLSSTGALLMETVIKNNYQYQMVHFRFGPIRWPDTCESALKADSHVFGNGYEYDVRSMVLSS